MTSYRGVKYHLKEYSHRGPQNPEELFNHWHSSLRNVIERTFGVLKKWFPTEPHYHWRQCQILLLHGVFFITSFLGRTTWWSWSGVDLASSWGPL